MHQVSFFFTQFYRCCEKHFLSQIFYYKNNKIRFHKMLHISTRKVQHKAYKNTRNIYIIYKCSVVQILSKHVAFCKNKICYFYNTTAVLHFTSDDTDHILITYETKTGCQPLHSKLCLTKSWHKVNHTEDRTTKLNLDFKCTGPTLLFVCVII